MQIDRQAHRAGIDAREGRGARRHDPVRPIDPRAGGRTRIDSDRTAFTNGRVRQVGGRPGGRSPSTSVEFVVEPRIGIGMLATAATTVHVSALEVVSCPARNRVTASSRTCRSLIPAPSSWAPAASDNTSSPVGSRRATAFDQRVDQAVEHRHRAIESSRGGERKRLGHGEPRRELPVELRQDLGERIPYLTSLVRPHVGIEERPSDDRERQRGHLVMQVQGHAVIEDPPARSASATITAPYPSMRS